MLVKEGNIEFHAYVSGQVPREYGKYYRNLHEYISFFLKDQKNSAEKKEVFWKKYKIGTLENKEFRCVVSFATDNNAKDILGCCVNYIYISQDEKISIIERAYLVARNQLNGLNTLKSTQYKILQSLADNLSYKQIDNLYEHSVSRLAELYIPEVLKKKDTTLNEILNSHDMNVRSYNLLIRDFYIAFPANILEPTDINELLQNSTVGHWLAVYKNENITNEILKFYTVKDAQYLFDSQQYKIFMQEIKPAIFNQIDIFSKVISEFYENNKINPYWIDNIVDTGQKVIRKDLNRERNLIDKLSNELKLNEEIHNALNNMSKIYLRSPIFPVCSGMGFNHSESTVEIDRARAEA